MFEVVRIKTTSETESVDVAGLEGVIHGETVPSASGVTGVIGSTGEDCAVYVHFEGRGEGYWFAPELLEFVHHGAGTEVRLDGADSSWVKTDDGDWQEVPNKKPWWKFW